MVHNQVHAPLKSYIVSTSLTAAPRALNISKKLTEKFVEREDKAWTYRNFPIRCKQMNKFMDPCGRHKGKLKVLPRKFLHKGIPHNMSIGNGCHHFQDRHSRNYVSIS